MTITVMSFIVCMSDVMSLWLDVCMESVQCFNVQMLKCTRAITLLNVLTEPPRTVAESLVNDD